jgi:hypothetical protein
MMLKDTTNDRGEYSIFLQEDHQYDVTVSKPSCLDPVAPGFVNAMRNCTDTTDYTQNFNIIDKSFTITLGKESNIPYFITGYWRPNTPENLVVFMKRDSTESKFHNIVYLNSGDYDYHSASLKIADILDQRVYKPIVHIVHTRLSEDCQGTKKILHIHVDGFTDKRTITPGDYLDENVPAVNGEPEIHNGDQMSDRFMQGKSQIGNRMLSHLRAYWTMVDVREHLRKQDQVCAELIEKGRITFDFKGNGIDDSITQNDAFNRRVDITASIE